MNRWLTAMNGFVIGPDGERYGKGEFEVLCTPGQSNEVFRIRVQIRAGGRWEYSGKQWPDSRDAVTGWVRLRAS